jgi:hypothetical protein
MRPYPRIAILPLSTLLTGVALAQTDQAPVLPVRELTVFKDGHAFVLHEGTVPVTPAGTVVLDRLPQPVLGTFWPYVAQPGVRLRSVVAGLQNARMPRPAATLAELVAANPGADILVTEHGAKQYPATIVGLVPSSAGDSGRAGSPLVVLKVGEGTKLLPADRLQDLTFRSEYRSQIEVPRQAGVLTLGLDWGNAPRSATAVVGMYYLQRGFRWIPSYKVDLDGKGTADVRLHASLVNELTSLSDVNLNLVVGVPSFALADSIDPVSAQETVAQLGAFFQSGSRFANAMSNALFSQTAQPEVEMRQRIVTPAEGERAGELHEGSRREDLYVHTVRGISLQKGERMVLPLASLKMPYRDLYALDLPLAPPAEFRNQIGGEHSAELSRLAATPRVQHFIRLSNNSTQPLTTAPGLLLREGKVISQALMTYTPVGAQSDVKLDDALDIRVRKEEQQVERGPARDQAGGTRLSEVKHTGILTIRNLGSRPAQLEVTRAVLGRVSQVDNGGKAESLSILDGDWENRVARPGWWDSVSWPLGWASRNPIGRITWNVKVDAGKSLALRYQWSYLAP